MLVASPPWTTLHHAACIIYCNMIAELEKKLHDATSLLQFNAIRVFNIFITNSTSYYLYSYILQSS